MIQIEHVGEVTKFRLARSVWGMAYYFTAAYWVDGLMVDTGCLYTVPELLSALEDCHVDAIVNTHSHEDHVAGNAALQARHNVKVLAHEEALEYLSDPGKRKLRPYQRVLWGYPQACTPSAIGDVVETRNLRFQVIDTPGHSPDHVSLFEPERGWLFTGDAYVGGRDRSLRADYNIWGIIASLKKMVSLEPRVLFTGSGSVRYDASQELVSKIDYLEEMGGRVLDLRAKGWTRPRIRKHLLGPEQSIYYITLGNFSARHLIRSYLEDRSCG